MCDILLQGTLSRSTGVLHNAQKHTSTWELCIFWQCDLPGECPLKILLAYNVHFLCIQEYTPSIHYYTINCKQY